MHHGTINIFSLHLSLPPYLPPYPPISLPHSLSSSLPPFLPPSLSPSLPPSHSYFSNIYSYFHSWQHRKFYTICHPKFNFAFLYHIWSQGYLFPSIGYIQDLHGVQPKEISTFLPNSYFCPTFCFYSYFLTKLLHLQRLRMLNKDLNSAQILRVNSHIYIFKQIPTSPTFLPVLLTEQPEELSSAGQIFVA